VYLNRNRSAFARYANVLLLGAFIALSSSAHGQTAASFRTRHSSIKKNGQSGFLPGVISIFAGNGDSNSGDYVDGSLPPQTAIGPPTAVASDSEGDVVFSNGSEVMMVYAGEAILPLLAEVTTQATPSVTPVAGHVYLVVPETTDTTVYTGEPANQAPFSGIAGMWFDSSDNLYLADAAYDSVFKVDHQTAIVTLVAGQFDVTSSYTPGNVIDGVPANTVALSNPTDVKTDAFGNIYIADGGNIAAFVIYAGIQPPPVLAAEGIATTPSDIGNIYTIAGQIQNYCSTPGSCTDGGPANGSLISGAISLSVDASGNVYILDNNANTVRLIYVGGTAPPLLSAVSNPQVGSIYTVIGLNSQFIPCATAPCGDGGTAANAAFTSPLYLAVDSSGNVFLDDQGDFAIRKIDVAGNVSTVAGIDDPYGTPPTVPTGGGAATATPLNSPVTIAFDAQDQLYIADGTYNIVWSVAPAQPQIITFPSLASPVTYGVAQIPLTASASSGLPIQYSVNGPASISGAGSSAALNITGAGTVVVTANQPGNAQYATATPVVQTLVVDQATLSVSALDASKIQGHGNPAFVAAYSGFVNEDTSQSALTGQPSLTSTATANSPVGAYPIAVSQGTLSSSNYTFVFVAGVLTVTGSTPQTISFTPPTPVTYGQVSGLALTGSASSGLAVKYTVTSGPGTVSGATLTILGGGTIAILAEQAGNNIYAGAAPVTQSLVVNPAPLTVTAPNLSLPFGTVIDPANFPAPIITGFVGSDGISLITGNAQYSTTASSSAVAGTYPLSVAEGTLALVSEAAASYAFAAFVPGSITILPAPQTISNLPLPTVSYNTLYTLTAAASSGLPVSFTATGPVAFYPAGNNTTAPGSGINSVQFYANGVGPATITITQTGNSSYAAAAPVVLAFNTNPEVLDVLANNATQEQGAPTPAFTYTLGANILPGPLGGFLDIPSIVSGIPVLTTGATPDSPPGTYPIVPSLGTLVSPVYSFNFINGVLTITPPGSYAITATPSSLNIPRGLSGQSTLTITPSNAYQGTVTLGCSQLPANVTCVISPALYNFPGSQNADGSENPAQGTITISTGSGTVARSLQRGSNAMALAGLLLPAILSGFWLTAVRRGSSRFKAVAGLLPMLACACGLLSLTSCGGGGQSNARTAAPGTLTVTISGSGTTPSGTGSVVATVPLTVTIQ